MCQPSDFGVVGSQLSGLDWSNHDQQSIPRDLGTESNHVLVLERATVYPFGNVNKVGVFPLGFGLHLAYLVWGGGCRVHRAALVRVFASVATACILHPASCSPTVFRAQGWAFVFWHPGSAASGLGLGFPGSGV
jgi:hypothetical protein